MGRLLCRCVMNYEDLWECEKALIELYVGIRRCHGEATARSLFASYGRRTAKNANEDKKHRLMMKLALECAQNRLDSEDGGTNLSEFARRLAEENKTLPRSERWGSRGTTWPPTMLRYLDRIRREKAFKLYWRIALYLLKFHQDIS